MAEGHNVACGFCGFVTPRSGLGSDISWTHHYRAVYCTGPGYDRPRLSGVGCYTSASAQNGVPPESHQRFDDVGLDPLSLVVIRDVSPPGPEIPDAEKATYSWGFKIHDACWSLLVRASAPKPVDVELLWRILLSVPCAYGVPNWGHTYGGLYYGTRKDQTRGEHFALLGLNSHLIVPSTFSDPFKVPELDAMIERWRIHRDRSQNADSRGILLHRDSGLYDLFAMLPFELKEMLLTYLDSADVARLRLASREMAAVPLSQHFFQSRFWPGQELEVAFDSLYLAPSDRRDTDWKHLYLEMKSRWKRNLVFLGERNRLRIWKQTIKPLVDAMDRISEMSRLKGGSEWKLDLEYHGEADWKLIKSQRSINSEPSSELRRRVLRAEVELPSAIVKAVHVSFMRFFGTRHITGIRISFYGGEDVEVGYISSRSEEVLHAAGFLEGFHAAVVEYGIRALALRTSQLSEFLEWAGDFDEALPQMSVKTNKGPVRKIRAAFDGFRMQAIFITEK
ncbi:hypothetical protein F4775DRAFT_590991 [Biscogniauxia sp. FL1348]|nr:hypothetical protein F4775DRAFT_590991 [Biscogniauxia sp. FL1348]